MRQSIPDKPRAIQWYLLSHFDDLDYAGELAILSNTLNSMQEKSN